MITQRALKLRAEIQAELYDLAENASIYGYDQQQTEKLRLAILVHLLPGFPAKYEEYLTGFWTALVMEIERRDLIYGGYWLIPPDMLRGRPDLQQLVNVHGARPLRPRIFISTHARRLDCCSNFDLLPEVFSPGKATIEEKGLYWPENPPGRPRPRPWRLGESRPQIVTD